MNALNTATRQADPSRANAVKRRAEDSRAASSFRLAATFYARTLQFVSPDKSHEAGQINTMLKPCPPEWLESVEVSTPVNSPRNNRAEVVEPLKPTG